MEPIPDAVQAAIRETRNLAKDGDQAQQPQIDSANMKSYAALAGVLATAILAAVPYFTGKSPEPQKVFVVNFPGAVAEKPALTDAQQEAIKKILTSK